MVGYRWCLNFIFRGVIHIFSFIFSYLMPIPTIIPKLTEDVSLKRARLDISQDESAIRISGAAAPGDITPITDALGTTSDTTSDSTVIGLLKQEVAKPAVDLTPVTDALGTTSDTTSDDTVIGLLKQEVAKPAADLTSITDTLGTTSDTTSDDTVIGLLKQEVAKPAGSTDITPITTNLGTTSDLSTDDTVIGLLKRINSRF